MSDYIAALRQDLVEAAERQQQHSPAARVARPLHPRNLSPLAVLGTAAAIAALVLVVVSLRTIGPTPRPADAQIVSTVHLGGDPRDAIAVGDALVIADFDGTLRRVLPSDPSSSTKLGVDGAPVSLAADGGAVWVVTEDATSPPGGHLFGPPRVHLLKLDARTGQRLSRIRIRNAGEAVAAGAVGAWLPAYLGPDTGIANPAPPAVELGALVVAERSLWTRHGTAVVQLDESGRAVRQVHGISGPLEFTSARTILPDADGAWVVGQTTGVLARIDGDRVSQRIKVGRSAGVLARVGTDVWVSAISSAGHYELVRVDGDEAKVTGRVTLGRAAPQVIVPVGKQLWVITSGGDALLINPE